MNKIEKANEDRYKRTRSPEFEKSYATNVVVDLTDIDIRLNFCNETLRNREGTLLGVIDKQIILHPQAAILLYEQLSDLLNEIEEIKGSEVSSARRDFVESVKRKKKND